MYIYIVMVATLLVLVRLFRGPSFADRAIAAGTIVNVVILLMVIYSITIQNTFYLDIAIVFAMLSFTGLLAVAKYAVWHEEKKKEEGRK